MPRLQNLRAVIARRRLAGDGRRVPVAQLDQLLHAACRVVKSEGLHPRMLGKKPPALRQRHGMRKHAVDVVDRRPRSPIRL